MTSSLVTGCCLFQKKFRESPGENSIAGKYQIDIPFVLRGIFYCVHLKQKAEDSRPNCLRSRLVCEVSGVNVLQLQKEEGKKTGS